MRCHFFSSTNAIYICCRKRCRPFEETPSQRHKYYDDYNTFMSDIIRQCYAEKVPLEEINGTESWYLSHHGIYHKKKKNKIRVVFDYGARYKDTYLKKRWRHVQYLTNEFWNGWHKEYLLLLQQRKKWNQVKRSLAVGDVMLIKDINTFRGNWSLDKVTELLIGDDQLGDDGRRHMKQTLIERPIHTLILLLESPH